MSAACVLATSRLDADMQIYAVKDDPLASRKFIRSSDGFHKVSLPQVWSQRCRERGGSDSLNVICLATTGN